LLLIDVALTSSWAVRPAARTILRKFVFDAIPTV